MKNRTIEMTKKFAAASSKFGTEEYKTLQEVRRDYPSYKVVTITRKASKSDSSAFKGLTYEYMEKYIAGHDDEEKSIMLEYRSWQHGYSHDPESHRYKQPCWKYYRKKYS